MDWNGGMDYGIDYGIFKYRPKTFFHSRTKLFCVAVYYLTYSQSALCCVGLHLHLLLEVVGPKVTCIFNEIQRTCCVHG